MIAKAPVSKAGFVLVFDGRLRRPLECRRRARTQLQCGALDRTCARRLLL
jgi:hypothetical protein